jgi:hypothetical protein
VRFSAYNYVKFKVALFTNHDVMYFPVMADCSIEGGRDGIHLVEGPNGRATGEAFVQPSFQLDLGAFTEKDRKSMGHRYIEVFKVKRAEMEWYLRRNQPGSPHGSSDSLRSSGAAPALDSDSFVRLRGLPFECTKEDIHGFFAGELLISIIIYVVRRVKCFYFRFGEYESVAELRRVWVRIFLERVGMLQ